MIARTIFEFAAILLAIYGVANEQRLVAWEDKVIAGFKGWGKSEKTS